eukprot:365072-Chlamydomonas_euryale.AAC.23
MLSEWPTGRLKLWPGLGGVYVCAYAALVLATVEGLFDQLPAAVEGLSNQLQAAVKGLFKQIQAKACAQTAEKAPALSRHMHAIVINSAPATRHLPFT